MPRMPPRMPRRTIPKPPTTGAQLVGADLLGGGTRTARRLAGGVEGAWANGDYRWPVPACWGGPLDIADARPSETLPPASRAQRIVPPGAQSTDLSFQRLAALRLCGFSRSRVAFVDSSPSTGHNPKGHGDLPLSPGAQRPLLSIPPIAQAALWLALILVLTGGAFWLMRRLRDGSANDTPSASDLLTKFRDLHARGGLSDEEYRTIRTKLAAELQSDLREIDGPQGTVDPS